MYAGLAIYDTMQHLRAPVSTFCVGMAASMAAVLLAAGEPGKRNALPNSRIMIHQPSGGSQGTAADMMKKAMIDVQAGLDEMDTGAVVLLQVHDELLLEVPEDEVDPVRDLVIERMEGAVELDVPIVAEWGVGRSWYECKG